MMVDCDWMYISLTMFFDEINKNCLNYLFMIGVERH
jgi:hypothetical protein